MAKTDIGGVWRTVGGRRIFIKDGEDLETAMKKSGKFKKEEIKEKKEEKDLSYQGKESDKAPITGKTADVVIKEVEKWEKEGKNSVVIERNKEAIETLKKIEGKPDEKIKIYRATPSDEINDGDWVFLDKQHAEDWTKTPFGQQKIGFKVVEMETEAKNVEWTGKNLEFAYREPKQPSINVKDYSKLTRKEMATMLVDDQIKRGIVKPESREKQIQARLTGQFKMSEMDLRNYIKKYFK
jgi:hypothetical protein